MQEQKQPHKQEQRQQQIPCGNDRQKSKSEKSGGCHLERADYAAAGQFYLEGVFGVWLGSLEGGFGREFEVLWSCGFAGQLRFGFMGAPGSGAYAAHGYAHGADVAVFGIGNDGCGSQREFVGGAVAQFEIELPGSDGGRQLYVGDEVAGSRTFSVCGVSPGSL